VNHRTVLALGVLGVLTVALGLVANAGQATNPRKQAVPGPGLDAPPEDVRIEPEWEGTQ
jgi:hypothetical protein